MGSRSSGTTCTALIAEYYYTGTFELCSDSYTDCVMLIPTAGEVTLWGNPTGNQGIYTAITDVVSADFTNVGTSFQSVTGYNTDDLPEYVT
jgi:hypothetical protein